jgi:YfiH family protein
VPGFTVEESPIGRIVVAPQVPAGRAVFYTTRDFEGRLTTEIARDLTALIATRFGIEASLTTCTQVHGRSAARARRESAWRECDSCDALWSSERGVALGIKVADCLPIAMVDPIHDAVANVHSGWRGAAQRITGKTLDTLMRETSFSPADAFAWLGPSIRACCFEVGEEVVDEFAKSYANAERYVDRSHEKPHIDLPALTADVLRERGFAGERIFDSKLCTRCDGSIFHSYRRDKKRGGRNLGFVAQ